MKVQLTTLIAFLFLSTSLFSQWQQANGPMGSEAYSIERIDGVLWVAAHSGLYLSYDAGTTWQRNETFLPEWSVTTVEYIEGEIFLTVVKINDQFEDWDLLLYRSTDGGDTWSIQDISSNFFFFDLESVEIFRIADRLFIWFDSRLFRSDDNGQTWIDLGNFFPEYFSEIGHDENNLIACDYFQLFLSTDFGDTWEFIDSVGSQADLLLEDDFIMVPTYDKLMVSNDLGQNWEEYTLPDQYFYGDIRREGSGKLYASGSRLFVSENNGATWDTINTVNSEYIASIEDFIEEDNGEYIVATQLGISVSSNQGSS